MRANEFIKQNLSEDIQANPKELDGSTVATLKSAVSLPGISMNKSNGNFYQQYRWMMATGLAGRNDADSEWMPAAGAMAGDPLIMPYTEEDFEKIKIAAKMTDAGTVKRLSNDKSEEAPETNRVSPVAKPKKNKYGI